MLVNSSHGLSRIITLEDVLEEMFGREIMNESYQVADKREFARRYTRRRIVKIDGMFLTGSP